MVLPIRRATGPGESTRPGPQTPVQPSNPPPRKGTGLDVGRAMPGCHDRAPSVVGVCGFSPTRVQPPKIKRERTPLAYFDHRKAVKDYHHLSADAVVLWFAEPLMYACVLCGFVCMML